MPSSSLKTVFEVVLVYQTKTTAEEVARDLDASGYDGVEVREVAK